jgi:hypothetical protein
MEDKERWENQEMREHIQKAVMETVATLDKERIEFLLWCVEGTPWEEWTKTHIAQVYRAKFYFDNVPRFV